MLFRSDISAQRSNEPTKSIQITLNSHPAGAAVFYEGEMICTSTPATVKIPVAYNTFASFGIKQVTVNPLVFTFVKDGYETGTETVTGKFVDTPNKISYGSGIRMKKIFTAPENVMHFFKTGNDHYHYEEDPTIPSGKADERVTRDNAGESELERTIIRWYFDSAPRGSRVFWRVISSVPEEVKNTNELYLGPTPFEETRSFNILGLTYANSRDVQIEVKVTKNGYMDQVKRFNVRQAIDQQEISSFFELVPAE